MSHLPPAAVVQLSPGEDQRLPMEGGRQAAAGGRHGARPGSTRQRNRVEGLTGGALCPGCPHPEGWPGRSPLNPAPSHPAALGCLPGTRSCRICAESPSASCSRRCSTMRTPHSPEGPSALTTRSEAEGLWFLWLLGGGGGSLAF